MKFLSELSKETIICSELLVKDYKQILKCSYGDEPNKLIFVETLCEILANTTDKSISYIKSLNAIDFFCLLLDIRANCLGDCTVVLTKDDKKVNVELNLGYIKEDTMKLFNTLSATIEYNGIEIVFECPCVERLLQPATDDYLSYIKKASVTKDGTKMSINIETNEEAETFFNKIPPKISLEIVSKFNAFVEQITGMNFLSRYGVNNQKLMFLPSIESLVWFTKLMFNESLNGFYDNLFYLSYSGKMSIEYIENSVVGEYNYFVSLLKQVIASKNSNKGPTGPDNSDDHAGSFDEDG